MSTLAAADRTVVRRIVEHVHRAPSETARLNARVAELEEQLVAARRSEALAALAADRLARERADAIADLTRVRLTIYSLRRSRSAHARHSREAREALAAAIRHARQARRELNRETAALFETRRDLRIARNTIRRLERKDVP